MSKVLNVGGNSKAIAIPKCYEGWTHHLLDIDPAGKPDVLCDAQELKTKGKYRGKYDSVYCSHNLEHYYIHKVPDVLEGFSNVLKADGFAWIAVPHMPNVLAAVAGNHLELTDPLYRLGDNTPISAHDIMYGWGKQMAVSGNEFFSHKCGFSPKMLVSELNSAGFPFCYVAESGFNITAWAFKVEPTEERLKSITAG